VLCPTRELADQVAGELRRLARFLPNTKILTLCGGQPFGAQRDSLQHAPHIIVATPGRLLDHLQKGTVSLDALQTLVMDEADRMLDMGFSDAIDEVIRFAPADRQTLLFSATWPEAIAAISGRVQKNPLTIEIDSVDALPAIEQQFFETSQQGKIPLLQKLLSQHQPASCVVFCNTKKDCQSVCDALNAAGQSALSLHGDLEQRDRDQTLVRLPTAVRACWWQPTLRRVVWISNRLSWWLTLSWPGILKCMCTVSDVPHVPGTAVWPSASAHRKRRSAPIFCLKCCNLS
jgi:ATP-independent RNA helicase DbpA